MSKKTFLAFLDITIVEIISQKNQTKLMKDYLKDLNGEVIFYSTESYLTIETLRLLESKISEKIKINGIIFYSALQFSYSGKFLFETAKKILKNKYEIYFMREDIKIKNIDELNNIKTSLKIFPDTHYDLIKNLKKNFYRIIEVK
tara:strand:+ start:973 stop:1407 length:435 start_codon:yes stop_codon:yes gene_type:complete